MKAKAAGALKPAPLAASLADMTSKNGAVCRDFVAKSGDFVVLGDKT